MENKIALGSAGSLDLVISGGKATVTVGVSGAALDGAVGASATASAVVDANVLIDKLFAEIEAKLPAGAVPIEETVKALIKAAVASI